MQVRSPSPEDPLEKEMATHSIILSGESHGQKSLMCYSPWGLRVGHECSNLAMVSEVLLTL